MVTLELMRRQLDYNRVVAAREWVRDLPVRSIRGSRVTLLGAGDIGRETAKRLRAFGPERIVAVNRSGRDAGPLFDETLPGLEAMFLLGAFGVSEDGATLRPLPETLDLGDVCPQGLPNYSGNLTYRFRGAVPASGAVRLAAEDWRGSAVGFRVNGGKEVFRPFPPYEACFAEGLRRDGTDEFAVTVYGHRRNAFGPFYLKGGEKWPDWTGPEQLSATDETERALVPFGLGVSL